MAKEKAYSKKFKDHKVLILNEDGSVLSLPVLNIDSGYIETSEDIFQVTDAIKYYNLNTGGFTYIFNLDLPAKVESKNLKDLRRSMVIKNLFSYDREKALDMKLVLPYIIAIAVIIFN
jgi:hypothetical protein